MKDICFLEINYEGPSENHKKLFENNKLCDFYFVTYGEKNYDNNCLGYFPNTTWGETRNKLYELIDKNQYEYYGFIDDDISFTSVTNKDFITQLKEDIEKTKPIVISPYYKNNNNEGKILQIGEYYYNYFGNNCCKIIKKEYLNNFFPLPVRYGGTFDCAHYFNLNELNYKRIICSHNIIMNNPEHRFNYGKKAKENMKKMWNDYKKFITIDFLRNNDDPFVIKQYFLKYNSNIKEENKIPNEIYNENMRLIQ